MKNKNIILIALAVIVIFALSGNPFYVVKEGQQVIVTQFGRPVGGAVTEAGLKLKMPFIQKVHYFEKRILEWDGDPNEIPTRDKRYIWIDTTARWRIVDALKFYQAVRDEQGGHSRLDDVIDAAVRDMITSYNLVEIIRTSNRILEESEIVDKAAESTDLIEIEAEALEVVEEGREEIRKMIKERAEKITPEYGIELIDVRIKRLNYVDSVKKGVYERMIAERKKAAEEYRSEGRGRAAEIEGRMERELQGIISEAYREAQEIEGAADAEAAKIYADAYGRDISFYEFIKTLETYKKSVDKETVVILSTESDYYGYLKKISR